MFRKALTKISTSWQKKYLEGMDQVAAHYETFHDVEYRWNVPYNSQDGTGLLMDLFRPKDKGSGPFPVALMVHGGGMIMGDRRMEMGISRHFAHEGFLAVALEYRVFPEVDIRGAILDIAGGMEEIGRTAANYGGDPERIYLVAESAGVYVSIYAAAMAQSGAITQAMGGRSPNLRIRAMAAQSGMFYTKRKDLVGMVMAGNIIPKGRGNEEIARLLDLELDEVAALLPPLFLVSSKGDFLKKYTLRYADFLEKHQKEYKLFFYDEGKPLIHAFPSLTPEEPESIAVDQMIARWFLEH